MFQSLSPVLVVEEVEPCVAFWQDRLGFQKVAEVPHEGRVGFAILVGNGVTLMYQSRASVSADLGLEWSPPDARRPDLLYVTVDGLEALLPLLEGMELAVPQRRTFYGADEIGVRDPAGNIVLFSHHAPAPE